MTDENEWSPTRRWRVVTEDGVLWAETSDEAEARLLMRPGDILQRLYERIEKQWVEQVIPPENPSPGADQ